MILRWMCVVVVVVLIAVEPGRSSQERLVPVECLHREPGKEDVEKGKVNCAVTNNELEQVLLASTINGDLFALDQKSGNIKWKLADEPVVKSPYDPLKPILPAFLPDPKDGALYIMGGSRQEPIKKLPFTIPELVAASPSKSADGILYSGKKVDTWFSVDRMTGVKRGALSHEGCFFGAENTCPAVDSGSFLIGRTEYNIMMYDTRTRDRRWNITYYDYSSNMVGGDSGPDYDRVHFSDSSTGALITIDKNNGKVEWEAQFDSPVVAMYLLDADSMRRVPFTSVSIETLETLVEQISSAEGDEKISETKLFPTLYVGEHAHGLFAVPSLVDKKTMMISPIKTEPLLLEGPTLMVDKHKIKDEEPPKPKEPLTPMTEDISTALLFGHYQVPDCDLTPASSSLPLLLSSTTPSSQVIPPKIEKVSQTPFNSSESVQQENTIVTEELLWGWEQLISLNSSFLLSQDLASFLVKDVLPFSLGIVAKIENKEMKVMVLLVVLTTAWFIWFVKNQFRTWEKMGVGPGGQTSANSSISKGSVSGTSLYEVTAVPVELDSGEVRVGNITFNPDLVLGKGCEGTFVYQGKFDNRDVAVKRILAACFSIADREVELLRESDEHPNVVRYFCMEQCKQFRYIALELCVATLQDVIEGKYPGGNLDMTQIFRQAVQGLAHLHALDIAHRDVKPQNVLISAPGRRGEIRAMISDFGLCKKLKLGRMSFSQRSGVAGTEGWIAPEMLLGHRSTTCMVDIFSLGCVYYYILTRGKHPFGENFHRQANILSGRFNLSELGEAPGGHVLEVSLIEKMIAFEPSDRPPTSALVKHPVFWSKEKTLSFLQEVSDRVDREGEESVVVLTLESEGEQVTGGDWLASLESAVREDLRRQRTYKGNTVKDLLRALRNKKHHYRELPPYAKQLYGSMPNGFTDYWTSRFPKLLLHTYYAIQCLKYEPTFTKYYDKNYDYLKSNVGPSIADPNIPDLREYRPPHALLPEQPVPRHILGFSNSDTSPQDSVISAWEDLDSDRDSFKKDILNTPDNDGMFPCYSDKNNKNEDSNQSLLGFVEGLSAEPLSDESRPVRKPVLPSQIPQSEPQRGPHTQTTVEPDPAPPSQPQVRTLSPPESAEVDETPRPPPTLVINLKPQYLSKCDDDPTPPRHLGEQRLRDNGPTDTRGHSPAVGTTEDGDNLLIVSDARTKTPGKRIRKRRKHQKKPRRQGGGVGGEEVEKGEGEGEEEENDDEEEEEEEEERVGVEKGGKDCEVVENENKGTSVITIETTK